MDTYTKFDHTIDESKLLDVLHDAASHGYMSWVVINGEYYTVKLDPEKISSADHDELF